MSRKIQVPAIGGLRKVIVPGSTATSGTTIAGLAGVSLTLAQLAAALGIAPAVPNTQSSVAPATLVAGPGLSGGGPIVGSVPIRLVAPLLVSGGEDGEDGISMPGLPGPPGASGNPGSTGSPGLSHFMYPDDPDDSGIPIPPSGITATVTNADLTIVNGQVTQAANGSGGGGGSALFNITPDSHPSVPTGVGLGPNDEFESGSVIDTTGARYSSATAWTAANVTTLTNSVAEGALIINPGYLATQTLQGFLQAVPAGNWTYVAKQVYPAQLVQTVGGGLFLRNALTGKILFFDYNNASSANAIYVTSYSAYNAAVANLATVSMSTAFGSLVTTYQALYYQIQLTGTSLVFSVSLSGLPGSFVTVFSTTLVSFIAAITSIGIAAFNEASSGTVAQFTFDWFRRTA